MPTHWAWHLGACVHGLVGETMAHAIIVTHAMAEDSRHGPFNIVILVCAMHRQEEARRWHDASPVWAA